MPTVTIPAGTLHYRTAGPADSTAPPVVFVHGFLVDSRLWDGVADRLAARGIRSYLVDWPLGSHRTPMLPDADLSPAGVARMINDVLDALGLDGVTLVGNDTGGAICQLLLADDPRRIGRVVLTNCDAFENFPPKAFVPLFLAAKRPALTAMLLAPMRLRARAQLAAGVRSADAPAARRRPDAPLDHPGDDRSPHTRRTSPASPAASIATRWSPPPRVCATSPVRRASCGERPIAASRRPPAAASPPPSPTASWSRSPACRRSCPSTRRTPSPTRSSPCRRRPRPPDRTSSQLRLPALLTRSVPPVSRPRPGLSEVDAGHDVGDDVVLGVGVVLHRRPLPFRQRRLR